MSLQWHFRPTHSGDDITDPITGEFFADGSLDNPATALVREALQNALDARTGAAGEPVHVRIALCRHGHALDRASADRWFATLWSHLTVRGNGLRDVPKRAEPCDYLAVEDFGTSGLTGNTESDSADGARNNFVDFMRSDGRTRKAAGERGSWGVGKNVFPRSSRINTFIAFTVRRDDGRRLVMGKSILKIRRVAGAQYQPPCYLGASWRPNEVPRPSEDAEVVQQLKSDFTLVRESEPGLSIVIPWVDSDISFDDIVRAVVSQFYYAILSGKLSVELANGADSFRLNQSTLLDEVRQRWPDHAEAIDLARWSLEITDRIVLESPPSAAAQKWAAELVPDAARQQILDLLTRRERVALRVPLHVRHAVHKDPTPTHFDVFLEHHDGDRTLPPSFFREQLAISSVKRAVGVPRVRALVVIDDKPLAELLRAAEPPNHTDWDVKTANFRNVYRDGNHVVTFVKSAVKQLMGYVRSTEDGPDATITMDFFSIVDRDEKARTKDRKPHQKPGEEPPPPFPGREPSPRPYIITRVADGFTVRSAPAPGPLPAILYVSMAYDVLLGSPWKQFEPADFDLTRRDRSGLTIETSGGIDWRAMAANRVQLRLDGSPFEFRVAGFDLNRDLIVRAYNPRERIDVDTPPELYGAQEAQS